MNKGGDIRIEKGETSSSSCLDRDDCFLVNVVKPQTQHRPLASQLLVGAVKEEVLLVWEDGAGTRSNRRNMLAREADIHLLVGHSEARGQLSGHSLISGSVAEPNFDLDLFHATRAVMVSMSQRSRISSHRAHTSMAAATAFAPLSLRPSIACPDAAALRAVPPQRNERRLAVWLRPVAACPDRPCPTRKERQGRCVLLCSAELSDIAIASSDLGLEFY